MAAPMSVVMQSMLRKKLSIGCHRLCTSVAKVSEEVAKPIKEPIKTRITNHFKRMVEDYRFSTVQTVELYKEKPIRMSIYTALAIASGYLFSQNPSMEDYENHLATLTCDLAEVGDAMRNKETSKHIQTLIDYQSQGRLRRFTLGVCSFIWVSEYTSFLDLYEAKCKEVQMTWSEWPEHIVDVGFLNRWLSTEKAMVDFDINPDEWKECGDAVAHEQQLTRT